MTIKEKLKDLQEMKIYLTKDIEAKKHVILNKIYSLDDRDKNIYHAIKIQWLHIIGRKSNKTALSNE